MRKLLQQGLNTLVVRGRELSRYLGFEVGNSVFKNIDLFIFLSKLKFIFESKLMLKFSVFAQNYLIY